MIRLSVVVTVDHEDVIKKTMQAAIKQCLIKAAMDTKTLANNRVPVDTGNLKGSIQTDFAEIANLESSVGTAVEYAKYVEFGTVKKMARPYLINSGEEVGESFVLALKMLLDSELK